MAFPSFPAPSTPPPESDTDTDTDELGYANNRVFRWSENLPTPARQGTRAMEKEQIQALHNAALAMPYLGEWNALTQQYEIRDPNMVGMTNAEVMIYRRVLAAAAGDEKATNDILDRTLGKPKQAMEVASMHISYSEFLEQSAAENRAREAQNSTINITPTSFADPLEELIRGV